MNFNLGSTAPDTHIELSWKTGFTIGFMIQIPLTKKFTLQSEYSYVQRYGTDESIGVDYSSNYLSIPVLLNYQLSSKIKLFAGPQVEFLINASSTYQGVNTKITHYVEERSLGITGGLEYDFINSFFLSARYFQGLNNIGIYQRSNVKEFKYEVIDITAGIRF